AVLLYRGATLSEALNVITEGLLFRVRSLRWDFGSARWRDALAVVSLVAPLILMMDAAYVLQGIGNHLAGGDGDSTFWSDVVVGRGVRRPVGRRAWARMSLPVFYLVGSFVNRTGHYVETLQFYLPILVGSLLIASLALRSRPAS